MAPIAETIPVIDLSAVLADWSRADDVAAEVDHACRTVGFFAVTGHGISDELRHEVLDGARRFFAMPTEVKERVAIANSSNNRGYAGLAGERLQADLPPDWKETFDIGPEQAADDPRNSPLEGPNQWPALERFREPMEQYQDQALDTAKLLLRLIARSLGLDDDFFDSRMTRPLVNMRLLRYPRAEAMTPDRNSAPDQRAVGVDGSGASEGLLGAGAHSDYGCLTLLYSDGVPGLQIRRLDGRWATVDAPAGALVVNIGDLLARWTNDLYRSTLHRVIMPTSSDRYSVPVFVNTDWHVDVTCLPACCSPDRPPRHGPVVAGEYLQSRFDDTFIYRDETQADERHRDEPIPDGPEPEDT